MEKVKMKEIKLSKLNELINELREILNETCCTLEEFDNSKERLIISQCLDELIVEYMSEVYKQE